MEALNKILAERLFKVQDAQVLNDPEKVSATWVKLLYGLVDELNDKETEMIGMKPKDAIVLDQVPLVKREVYPPEEVLPEDGLLSLRSTVKSIRLKTKELQSNEVEASDFAISQFRDFAN